MGSLDESIFADLQRIAPPMRWLFVAARSVFAVCIVAGAITFIAHWIMLMIVLKTAATAPFADHTYRIISHGDSRYVTDAAAQCLKVLSITMVVGLTSGMIGECLLQFTVRRLSRAAPS